VEDYRKCPNCWNNLGGKGRQKSRPDSRPPTISPNEDVAYYTCDECGTRWKVTFSTERMVINGMPWTVRKAVRCDTTYVTTLEETK
jgi:hypothetical protein